MSNKVYERLRDDIISGVMASGDALGEVAMAERYGTSRTPVREALRRLEQEGLIERGDRGMRVRTQSPEEILDIYDVRVVLETMAARWAAARRTEFDMKRLHAAHKRMLALDGADTRGLVEGNRRFHETLWVASRNSELIDLLRHLNAHLTRYPATTLTWPGRWDAVLAEHTEMIEAIEDRDADRAAAIAESHMGAAREIRLMMASEEDDDDRG
jgi:DNA-binding GntR family transcriptional regulator